MRVVMDRGCGPIVMSIRSDQLWRVSTAKVLLIPLFDLIVLLLASF